MIVVNPGTRQFNVPGADLVFGVEADSGSEIKHFQCPRFVGNNVDVANSFVRINYRNANGETDFYLVDDMTVDGDNVHFSWVLAPRVTAYKGQVKFVMCVVGPDLKIKWHTAMGTGQVHEGLEPDQSHVEDETADVVAALIAMVDAQTVAVESEGSKQIRAVQDAAQAAQTAAVAEIEAKGNNTRNSIPAEYTALSKTVDNLTRERAGAIVCETEGTAVTLSDASDYRVLGLRVFGRSTQAGVPTPQAPFEIESAEDPVVGVHGRNLFPVYPEVTTRGITVTHEPGGWIVLNGTANPDASMFVNVSLPAGTYFFTANNNFGIGESLADSPYIAFRDEGRNWMASNSFAVSNYTRKFEVARPITSILLAVPAGLTINNWRVKFQLEIGETGSEYEEYTDQTIPISRSLRGIPVTSDGNYTDANGQRWICDEVDLERGVYVQRVGRMAFDGTETAWRRGTMPTGEPMNYVYFSDYAVENLNLSLCSHSVFAAGGGYWNNGGYMRSGTGYWQTLTDMALDEWKAYLSEQNANGTPLVVCYVLSKPTETPLSETEIAAYRSLHSNYPNTTVLNDAGAHMIVKYAADTKLYIDQKIKEALL